MAYPTLTSGAAIATVEATTLFFFVVAMAFAVRREDGTRMTAREFARAAKTPNVRWMSAKHSLPWQQVGLSYFAGGMGAWVYYGTT